MEVYQAFLRHKAERTKRRAEAKIIEADAREAENKLLELDAEPLAEKDEWKALKFKGRMELLRNNRRERDILKLTLRELKMKLRHASMFDTNFFR